MRVRQRILTKSQTVESNIYDGQDEHQDAARGDKKLDLTVLVGAITFSKGLKKGKRNSPFLHCASARTKLISITFIIITCAIVVFVTSTAGGPILTSSSHQLFSFSKQQTAFMSSNKEEELLLNTNSCTKDKSIPPFPSRKILSLKKYERIKEAERVVAYIAGKLGTPISLMFGTLLHEFRNGTGPCVRYNLMDKDFDIVVFETHFHDIIVMTEEIQTLFGWKVKYVNEERLFLMLFPGDQNIRNLWLTFQIDVYGFRADHPRNGLIHFPWSNVTVAVDAFLPLVKHKAIASDDGKHVSSQKPQLHYYYRPFNPSCVLANVYGSDFMTPKNTKLFHQKAFDDPKCDRSTLKDEEKTELERQLVEYGGTATTGKMRRKRN